MGDGCTVLHSLHSPSFTLVTDLFLFVFYTWLTCLLIGWLVVGLVFFCLFVMSVHEDGM